MMHRHNWLRVTRIALFLGLFAGLVSETATAQLPQARLYGVFPPGGKAGSTVEVTLANGADLEDVSKLLFSHPGITAVQKMQGAAGAMKPVPNVFVVNIAADVPSGNYDIRAVGYYGATNPRTFVVGSLPESIEKEPNNDAATASEVAINSTVNGQCAASTDIDWFKFNATKGQRILLSLRGYRLDSRLLGVLEFYDANGRRLFVSQTRHRSDPFLDVTIPADGTYFVRVRDTVYRGGQEYTYRLTVKTGPHIDFVIPPSALPGTTGTFTLYGRNLPGGQPAGIQSESRPLEKLVVQIPVPANEGLLYPAENFDSHESSVDGFSYVFKGANGESGPVTLRFASAPVVLEQEPNNEPAQAQKITLPAEFVGQFQEKGDVDYVTFDAKAGEVYNIEVFGHRDGTTMDPYLILQRVVKDAQGMETVSQITVQDDNPVNAAANLFDTHSDDPNFRFAVPADGTYRLSLRDRYFESRGDPRLVYRLSITKEKPDFRFAVVPYLPPPAAAQPANTWALGLRKGESVRAHVVVFRRDNFTGPIEISVEGLPAGVECKGAFVGTGQSTTDLIFTAAENAAEWSGAIKVLGKATIADPAKAQAVVTAKAAVAPATNALAPLAAALKTATDAHAKAVAQHATAKANADKNPKDKNLANQLAAAQKAVDAAAVTLKTATANHAAGVKRLEDAKAAVAKAEAENKAATRQVVHEGRTGTIVWPGVANGANAISRITRNLELAVMREVTPLSISANVPPMNVNQGSQILVPVKLTKRLGFDNAVTLTFVGIAPNTNITIENAPIAKGKNEEIRRIFVNPNATPGEYTVYLQGQAQVSYGRHQERLDKAKAAQAEAVKTVAAADAVAKKAAADLAAATAKANADAAAAKTTATAKGAADAKLKAANDAVASATAAQAAAGKVLTDAQAALTKATTDAANATKAAAADAKNKGLQDAKVAAEKAVTAAQTAVNTATANKTAADKRLADAQAAAKVASDAVAVAQKAVTTADEVAKASLALKTTAETASKDAAAKLAAANATKTAADQEVTAATAVAKPANINYMPPSTPILLRVKPAPYTLVASPAAGSVKKGAKVDVKVTVVRKNGFAGPVTLLLPDDFKGDGVTAVPVTIPADKNEGTLSIQAAANATEGAIKHLVVRAASEFDGKAAVDAPIVISVTK